MVDFWEQQLSAMYQQLFTHRLSKAVFIKLRKFYEQKIQAVVIQLFTHVIKSPRNKTGTKIQRCVFLFLTSFPFVTSFSFCFPKFVLAMSHDVTGRIFIMSLSWWIACLRLSTANNEFEFCREREKELRYSYTTQTSPYSFFLIDIYSFL